MPPPVRRSLMDGRELASFGETDDAASFGTPLMLADEIGIALPSEITGLLSRTENNGDLSGKEYEGEEEDLLHVKEPRLTEGSTDSLMRRSPVSNELYEMITATFRRLDALEESVRKIQSRLDAAEAAEGGWRAGKRREWVKVLLGVSGSVSLLYILFRLIQARRQ